MLRRVGTPLFAYLFSHRDMQMDWGSMQSTFDVFLCGDLRLIFSIEQFSLPTGVKSFLAQPNAYENAIVTIDLTSNSRYPAFSVSKATDEFRVFSCL